jgi:hypothetical protein
LKVLRMEKPLAMILLLAGLVRIPVFALASIGYFPVGEGQVQLDLARNILNGKGFQLSQSMMFAPERERTEFGGYQMEFYRRVDGFYGVLRPGQPTMYLVPGMALFLAAVMLVFGQTNLLAIQGVQLLLGILTVFMGYRIASRFLSGRWLYAAGALLAVSPYELYYQAIPATQGVFSVLITAGFLFSLRTLEKPGFGRGSLAGLVWGAAFMVRPIALPIAGLLVVLMLIYSRFSGRSLLAFAGVALCFAAVLLPWGIRNRRVTGDFAVMPTQGGLILWEFNGRVFSDHFRYEQPGAVLLYQPIRDRWLGRLSRPELAEFPDFTDETESHRDSVLSHRQLEFLRSNPLVFGELVLSRFVDLFKPFPLNDTSRIHAASGLLWYFWMLVFAVAGGILLLKKASAVCVFLVFGTGGYLLSHLLMAGGTPYRVAVDLPLLVMALYALRYSVMRFRARGTLSA